VITLQQLHQLALRYREARKVTLRSILVAELGDDTLQRAIAAIFDVLATSLLTGVYHSTLYASNYAVQKASFKNLRVNEPI
jgi:hypothetical protein